METYTFSRALHMMRYGGKKMKHDMWDKKDGFLFVENNYLRLSSRPNKYIQLQDYEIMGSWVEAKE